jgi:hypothetical protein
MRSKKVALVLSLILTVFIIGAIPLTKVSAFGNRCPNVWQRSEGVHLCIGTEQNDHIDGSKAPDVVIGLAGDDLLRGGSGNDVLQAGFDDDKVYGNSGDDNLQGGPGLD